MTSLPNLLQTRLDDARAWLDRHYYISIWHRQAIYDALGPPAYRPLINLAALEPAERQQLERWQRVQGGTPPVHFPKVFGTNRTAGHIRRTYLSMLTVEHILPIWEQCWYPLGNRTRETVPKLIDAVRRIYDGENVSPEAGSGRISLFDTYDYSDMVHYAAGRAYDVAVFDAEFELYPLTPFQPDPNLSGLRNDIPRMAALATGDELTFWLWWLDQAIPAAWRAHPDPITASTNSKGTACDSSDSRSTGTS